MHDVRPMSHLFVIIPAPDGVDFGSVGYVFRYRLRLGQIVVSRRAVEHEAHNNLGSFVLGRGALITGRNFKLREKNIVYIIL